MFSIRKLKKGKGKDRIQTYSTRGHEQLPPRTCSVRVTWYQPDARVDEPPYNEKHSLRTPRTQTQNILSSRTDEICI